MVRIEGLSANYETTNGSVNAISEVNLNIDSNEIIGIAGESGCGKSSLLKTIYGNVEPPMRITNGRVVIEVNESKDVSETFINADIRRVWWRHVSYVPQGAMNVLNPVSRIESQFMDSVTRYHKQTKRQIHERIVEYLRNLELPEDVLRAYPHQLSGGMRQRVVIAIATFLRPDIVLADEPTTALDVVVQREILQMLVSLQREMENTLIIVSHDMGVHYQITKRMCIMYAGRMVEIGSTQQIFENPAHPYTQALINSLPRIGDTSRRLGLEGVPPKMSSIKSIGCRFYGRCPVAKAICNNVKPQMVEVEPAHYVECHLYQ